MLQSSTLDDVFEIHPHEGASVESNFSVESLEDRIVKLMEENRQLRQEINCLTTPKQKTS